MTSIENYIGKTKRELDIINKLHPNTLKKLNKLTENLPEEIISGILSAFELPLKLAKEGGYTMDNISGEGLREIMKDYDLDEKYHGAINNAYIIGLDFVGLVTESIFPNKRDVKDVPEKINLIINYLDNIIATGKLSKILRESK